VPTVGDAGGTAGAGGAGHAFRMNGAGPGGPGIGGFCGRPTTAVAHVPTHRSAGCARAAGWSAPIAKASMHAEIIANIVFCLCGTVVSSEISIRFSFSFFLTR
jgi:hypothetical protein